MTPLKKRKFFFKNPIGNRHIIRKAEWHLRVAQLSRNAWSLMPSTADMT